MNQISDNSDQPSLRDRLWLLWTHRWSILIVTAVTVGVALFYTSKQEPVYTSEARVLVETTTLSSSNSFNNLINLDTEIELAESEDVARRAALQLGRDALVPGSLSVSAVDNTAILSFQYVSADPEAAPLGADAFAQAYLDFKLDRVVDQLTSLRQSLQARKTAANNRLARVNDELNSTSDPSRAANLQARANSIAARITILQQQMVGLASPDALQVGRITQPAGPPLESGPKPLRNGALALFAGLVLGAGAGLLRDQLSDRLTSQGDLELLVGAQLLATIPSVRKWRANRNYLVTLEDPHSPAAESFKTLRTGIMFAAQQRGLKTILVTSPNPGEGKSGTAANLATAVAHAGRAVFVVSADLRRPTLHQYFGQHNYFGLADVLAGERELLQVCSPTAVQNLQLLSSGPTPIDPTEKLASDAMKTLIHELANHFDFAIIDAPPLHVAADAMILAPLVDGVLLVADARQTTRNDIQHARQLLDQVQARVIGCVLNGFHPGMWPAHARYYGYYKAYRHTTDLQPVIEEVAPDGRPS